LTTKVLSISPAYGGHVENVLFAISHISISTASKACFHAFIKNTLK